MKRVLPSRLPEPALVLLRRFLRAGLRTSGCEIALASPDGSDGLEPADREQAVAVLEEARLVRATEDRVRLVLTDEGEAFFDRFFWECRSG